MAIIICDNDQ